VDGVALTDAEFGRTCDYVGVILVKDLTAELPDPPKALKADPITMVNEDMVLVSGLLMAGQDSALVYMRDTEDNYAYSPWVVPNAAGYFEAYVMRPTCWTAGSGSPQWP
jgi:hypothetical protein